MVEFFEIDLAFNFVSGAGLGMNSAYLCRDTGKIYYQSGLGDSDKLPDDLEDKERYIEIPHKNDLDLGIKLVREFIADNLPQKAQEVESFFRRKGAYSRFKELLDASGALEKWYEFEQVRTELALREWCAQNDIVLSELSIQSQAL